MNILDTKTMMQWNAVGEFSAPNVQHTPQSKVALPKLDAFPTLLNIPWNGQDIEKSDYPEEGEQKLNSVEHKIVQSGKTASKKHENSVADILSVVQSGKDLPGGELAKAIAHVLTMNSNLSISINVENADDVKLEKERLIDRYQHASAAGSVPVFSWSPQYAPNLEKLDNAYPVTTQTATMPKEKVQVMPQRSQSVLEPAVLTKAPSQIVNATEVPDPARENGSQIPAAKNISAEPSQKLNLQQPVTDRSRVEATAEQRIQTESAKKILPEPLPIERQTQITNVKKEGHIPFLQPIISTQVPELVSRISTGLQTTGSSASPESNATGQSATKAVARIEVQLVPKNLGTVQVSIQKQDGMVSVLIRTETQEAEKVLSNETNSIREALRNANLTLDEIRIQPMGSVERENELRGGKHFSQETEYQQEGFGFGHSEPDSKEHGQRHSVFGHANNSGDSVPDLASPELKKRLGLYL